MPKMHSLDNIMICTFQQVLSDIRLIKANTDFFAISMPLENFLLKNMHISIYAMNIYIIVQPAENTIPRILLILERSEVFEHKGELSKLVLSR